MSEESKNVEKTEQGGSELSDKDLEQVAGGGFDYKYLPHDDIPFKKVDVPDVPLAPLKL